MTPPRETGRCADLPADLRKVEPGAFGSGRRLSAPCVLVRNPSPPVPRDTQGTDAGCPAGLEQPTRVETRLGPACLEGRWLDKAGCPPGRGCRETRTPRPSGFQSFPAG